MNQLLITGLIVWTNGYITQQAQHTKQSSNSNAKKIGVSLRQNASFLHSLPSPFVNSFVNVPKLVDATPSFGITLSCAKSMVLVRQSNLHSPLLGHVNVLGYPLPEAGGSFFHGTAAAAPAKSTPLRRGRSPLHLWHFVRKSGYAIIGWKDAIESTERRSSIRERIE